MQLTQHLRYNNLNQHDSHRAESRSVNMKRACLTTPPPQNLVRNPRARLQQKTSMNILMNLHGELRMFFFSHRSCLSHGTQSMIQRASPGSDPASVSMTTRVGLPSVPFWESQSRGENFPCSRMAFLWKQQTRPQHMGSCIQPSKFTLLRKVYAVRGKHFPVSSEDQKRTNPAAEPGELSPIAMKHSCKEQRLPRKDANDYFCTFFKNLLDLGEASSKTS